MKIDTINVDQVVWTNRHSQTAVQMSMRRALNGAPHIQQFVVTSGFDVELSNKDGFMPRSLFEQLQLHSQTVLTVFAVDVGTETFSAMWDHRSGPAVSGVDLFDEHDGSEFITNVVLKLIRM
jgi:hypothetical protein